ncbi:MAG: D-alanyl-D-alanine serine-type carboxypeptidase [Gammaproteobacteria bacterium]|jgi:D-alanyl-D-alanine carboxypeptidase (penicillin-binding protein 5/6)|nr:D-alanyl-D-alanine serine-type carboxypeptidase [Gammaproteobacteria bacterium]
MKTYSKLLGFFASVLLLGLFTIPSLAAEKPVASNEPAAKVSDLPAAPNLSKQVLPSAPTYGSAVGTAIVPKPSVNDTKPMVAPAPPEVQGKGYILLDADSGYVIAENNADERAAPASLTKLMTMYVISGMLNTKRISLDDQVLVSEKAWRTGGSRMFIQVGTHVPVKDLVNGIIVASGNDACVAMSEHVAGSEESFVGLMNQAAQHLGMTGTHYSDSTGLPDPDNYTTPRDQSILTRAIIQHYPQDYSWYKQKEIVYNNIKQPNRNLLLWRDPSVDGLKTGFTDDAGYCLVASAKREDMRLIAIVMGSPSTQQRSKDVQALLNYGFRFYKTSKLYEGGTTLKTLPVWFGKEPNIALGVQQSFYVTVPVGSFDKLKATISVDPSLEAPIVKGQAYGEIKVMLGEEVVSAQPLIALEDNPEAGFISRTFDRVKLFISNLIGIG